MCFQNCRHIFFTQNRMDFHCAVFTSIFHLVVRRTHSHRTAFPFSQLAWNTIIIMPQMGLVNDRRLSFCHCQFHKAAGNIVPHDIRIACDSEVSEKEHTCMSPHIQHAGWDGGWSFSDWDSLQNLFGALHLPVIHLRNQSCVHGKRRSIWRCGSLLAQQTG